MDEETSINDELSCKKCLSCIYVYSKLHEGAAISEIQKLRDVTSWAELFPDHSPVGDSIQDCDTKKEQLQKSGGIDAVDKSFNDLGPKLPHPTISSSFISVENSSEQAERHSPFASKSLSQTQILKLEGKGGEIRVVSNNGGELEADGYMYSSIRASSFHTLPTICQDDDSRISTQDLPKNDTYFWPPANDSSDEELPCVQTNSLKLAITGNQKDKRSLGKDIFFKPLKFNPISPSMLRGRLPCKGGTDSCERWNPGMENLLEVKEDKCKGFTWTPKLEVSSGTNHIMKNIHEETAKRNIPFTFQSEVKKVISRDEILDFQPLKEAVEHRNESRMATLGIDKSYEESKNIGKDQTQSMYDRDDFKRDQRKMELRFTVKDPTVQINCFYRNSSQNDSENCTDEIASNCLNCLCERTKLDSNGGSILDMSPLGEGGISCHSNMIPMYMRRDIKESTYEKDGKSIVGSKSNTKEVLNTSITVDDHKQQFQSDQSQSDDSVLAKYYFYLNYLRKLRRLQSEDDGRLPSCQSRCGFSKETNMAALDHCKRDSLLLYVQQAKEHRNNASGSQEIRCDKDNRTEALEQLHCPEEQEFKPLLVKSSPKLLSNLALPANIQLKKPHISKDKKAFEARKTVTDVSSPMRHWESASMAWSSYPHGEKKPSRSQYVQMAALGSKSRRKSKYKSLQSHPSSGTESKQEHETSIQAYDEINTKMHGDHNLFPWLLLPDELWFYIFSLLTHKDISRVSQVCHRFYHLAGDGTFWKNIQLTDCHCLNDDWLVTLGNHHPRRFTLDHCHDEAQKITDVGWRHFFQCCGGSLMEFSIKSCSGPGFQGDTILLHASTFCHNLTTIDVSWTGATDAGLSALAKASRSLHDLSANGCQFTDDSIVTLVEKHGESLRKLEIFGCHAVTAKGLTSVAVKCQHLKVLNIGGIHKITEDCLAKIVNSMRNLTSLNCMGLCMVRDCVVHFIVKKLPELECLVLSCCSQVTDIALTEISSYLPTIRHLDISGCEEVTDVGVQALVSNCSKLSYIDLSSTATSKRGWPILYCGVIPFGRREEDILILVDMDSNYIVCLLASFCFRTLECVKLNFCKDISLEAIVKLCRNCKKLKILHLYGCCFVPDLESVKKINKNVEVFHDLHTQAATFSSE